MTAVSLFHTTFRQVNKRFVTANKIRDEFCFASRQKVSFFVVAVSSFAEGGISIQRDPNVYFAADS
jgi:hypothetical protein